MLARLEHKLGSSLGRQEIDDNTREALSALSFVHQRVKEKIRGNLGLIRELKIARNNVKGSIYARAMEWIGLAIFLLAIPTIFTLPTDEIHVWNWNTGRHEVNWEVLSPVTTLMTVGILIIVISAIAEYYTKFLETERIEKRIESIETETEAFSNENYEETNLLLTKLADQIRVRKDMLRKEKLKKKIHTFVMAYKEAKMKSIAAKFKININQAEVIMRELIKEGKLKGIFKDGGKSFVVA